jgi:hypothetical protein
MRARTLVLVSDLVAAFRLPATQFAPFESQRGVEAQLVRLVRGHQLARPSDSSRSGLKPLVDPGLSLDPRPTTAVTAFAPLHADSGRSSCARAPSCRNSTCSASATYGVRRSGRQQFVRCGCTNLASYLTDLVIIYTLFRYGGATLPRFVAGGLSSAGPSQSARARTWS